MNLHAKDVLMIVTFVPAQTASKHPRFTQFEIQTCAGRRRYGAALGTPRTTVEKCAASNCRGSVI
jgi:hypothetical protein